MGTRPGLVFIALLALLLGVYVLLVDILGSLVTYLVQALIVIALIVVMRRITNGRNPRPWERSRRHQKSTASVETVSLAASSTRTA